MVLRLLQFAASTQGRKRARRAVKERTEGGGGEMASSATRGDGCDQGRADR